MQWALLWNYLPFLLRGAGVTMLISLVSIAGGTVLAGLLAVVRTGAPGIVRVAIATYVWLIRGTPLLLQIIIIYYWLPSFGIRLPAIAAGMIVLGVNASAYYTEIFRGAIDTVPRGQSEASLACGMTPLQTMRRIVLPQAARAALPAYIGQSIGAIKNSSLVSVISVEDLMFTSQSIYSSTYRIAETIGVAGVLYLAMTSVLQLLQLWVERRGFGGARAAARR